MSKQTHTVFQVGINMYIHVDTFTIDTLQVLLTVCIWRLYIVYDMFLK